MRIALASDKAGFRMKEVVKAHLLEKQWEVADVGLQSADAYMPFYTAAHALCELIQSGQAERGILVCGTGAGMCMDANRHEGVYAVVCESIYTARMCRIVNDANVLALGGNVVGPGLACEMVDAFLTTDFCEGVSEERRAYFQWLGDSYQETLKARRL